MGKYLKSVAAALVVVVAFSLGNIRQANAHFADGALIAAAIAALEAAVTYAIEYFSTAYVNMSIQMASSQATAEAEKIVATIAETARGQEVARAQNQLQRDAVAIKEAMKLPPFACQTLAASDATARADDGARDTAKELSLSQSKRGLETTNTAAEVSKLYSDIERARQAAPVSATTLLGPKTYTAAEEASADVVPDRAGEDHPDAASVPHLRRWRRRCACSRAASTDVRSFARGSWRRASAKPRPMRRSTVSRGAASCPMRDTPRRSSRRRRDATVAARSRTH